MKCIGELVSVVWLILVIECISSMLILVSVVWLMVCLGKW